MIYSIELHSLGWLLYKSSTSEAGCKLTTILICLVPGKHVNLVNLWCGCLWEAAQVVQAGKFLLCVREHGVEYVILSRAGFEGWRDTDQFRATSKYLLIPQSLIRREDIDSYANYL